MTLPAAVWLGSPAAAAAPAPFAASERPPAWDTISLWQGRFDPLDGPLAAPSGFDPLAEDETEYQIVQLAGPVRPEWTRALAAMGRIVDYVPHHAYLMQLPSGTAGVRALDFVRAVSPHQPHYKVHPGLIGAAGDRRLLVDVFPWEDARSVISSALALGARLEKVERSEWHTTVMFRGDASIAPALARMDEVRWIQWYEDPTLANGEAQWVVQSGVSGVRPIWNHSLRGEGQYVAYADTGMDYDHSFFRDANMSKPGKGHRKVVSYYVWEQPEGDQHGHGTHVSGSITGNDRPNGGSATNIGQAPAAVIHVDDAGTGNLGGLPKDLNNLFEVSFNNTNSSSGEGARVHSNSWGWPSEHNYTQAAATTDEFMANHRDYLVVIAAGNERNSGANSLRSPGLAKNVVTVGATENGANSESMASFSSVGPTQGDGRMKPTVCAPGSGIMSALNDNNLNSNNSGETSMSGTSMATPTTTGSLALIRQWYTEGRYPTGKKSPSDAMTPTAALMKATLIAGAVEISGTGSDFLNEGVYPNNSQGWGRVNLENSLYFEGDTSKTWVKDDRAGVQTGANLSFKFKVNGVNAPLRVMLVWTDAPGAIFSNPSIVNDLDLIVTSPGATYLGNNFAGKGPGHSVAGGSQDRVNVEEGVILPDAANGLVTGEYTVNVVGQNVPRGPQPFALVVTGDIEGQAAVAQVTIAPTTASVEVAKSAQFQARALDTAGNDVPGAKFTYTVTPASLGTASDLGNGSVSFTAATKTGSGILTATASGKTANATLTVTAGPIATLTVDPSSISIAVKGSAPVRAIGKDQYGNDATPSSVAWTVSAGLDATVSGGGASVNLVAGVKAGSGELTADAAGKIAKATVTIAPGPPKKLEAPDRIEAVVGSNVSVSARVLDEYGNEIASATANWATASSLGTFSPSTGLAVKFKAGAKSGNSTFSVTSGALNKVGELYVLPGPPTKVIVTPATVSLDPQGSQALKARVEDQHGNEIKNATVKWEPPSFATVSPDLGLETTISSEAVGGAQGSLRAVSESAYVDVPVTVNPFWSPGAIGRGGLAATIFISILLAVIGAIGAGVFVAMRRRHVACPRCSTRNLRTAVNCFACGTPLGAGAVPPGPGGPPGGPGMPPGGPVPPPPDDWSQPPPQSSPPGPGYAEPPPQQYGHPYPQAQGHGQPPPGWGGEEPMPPSPGRRPPDGWQQ
jgi:hypothetical protein